MQFLHPCTIVKAETHKDRLRVILRASTEAKDRAGEVVLKSALADRQMQANFGRQGYYDYNHLTDIIDAKMKSAGPAEMAQLQLEKVKGIIGYPDQERPIYIEDDGVYSIGDLIPGNAFVAEIRKGLDSGWKGWGASISGLAHPSAVENGTIKSLSLRKIAICPLQEAINPETSVGILKSFLPLSDIAEGRRIAKSDSLPLPDMAAGFNDMDRRRLDVLWRLYLNSYEFGEAVKKEFQEAIRSERLKMEFDEIVEFLVQRFAVGAEDAKEAANGILKTIQL